MSADCDGSLSQSDKAAPAAAAAAAPASAAAGSSGELGELERSGFGKSARLLAERAAGTAAVAAERAAGTAAGAAKGAAGAAAVVAERAAGTAAVAAERAAGTAAGAAKGAAGAAAFSAVQLLEAVSGAPVAPGRQSVALNGGSKHGLRGIFGGFGAGAPLPERGRSISKLSLGGRRGNFMQCLDMLTRSEENARCAARRLHTKMGDGNLSRLDAVMQQVESKWEFPAWTFPLLQTHLRRLLGVTSLVQGHISEADWQEVFSRWLHAIQDRCGRSTVSRQCFVHKRTLAELNEAYLEGKRLGEGAFGEVSLALHKSLGVARVVKKVNKTQVALSETQIEAEVDLLRSLDHPHIVRIFEAFETDDALHIVMDYAAGGDVASVIEQVYRGQDGTLAESWVCEACAQTGSALQYMHSKGVIHCDLKPANVMLLREYEPHALPHVLLVDFGIAEIFEEKEGTGNNILKGSPAYVSPEGFEGRLSDKSDMWLPSLLSRQIMLLGFVLVLYSMWSLLTESWKWSPTITRWDQPVLILHNVAWLFLATTGACVCFRSYRELRKPFRAVSAVGYERLLCAWGCLVAIVGGCFANRLRVASVCGVNAADVFNSVNSDYDLLVAMVGSLMYFSMRTHMRLVSVLPVAVCCLLTYVSTSLAFRENLQMRQSQTVQWWLWPSFMLAMVSFLALSGQRIVEYNNRIAFLSFYASYAVLAEAHATDPGLSGQEAAGVPSRSARLRRALELLQRFTEDPGSASRPLRVAVETLVEVLQAAREDVARADRMLTVDIEELLRQRKVSGPALDALLALFDAARPPELPPRPPPLAEACAEQAASQSDAAAAKAEAWGWDTLPPLGGRGSVSVVSGLSRPLRHAGEDLLVAAALEAAPWALTAAADSAPCTAAEVRAVLEARARAYLESLVRDYARQPSSTESRAALALHAARWLAQRSGLWDAQTPWERLALLVAAAGLHCAGSGGAYAEDPLLARSASAKRALEALDASGLSAMSGERRPLRSLVKRLLLRARPRCMLDDARHVRVALEQDALSLALPADRAALASVVLAAADFAFLALPRAQDRRWAAVCAAEAQERRGRGGSEGDAGVDMPSWFWGLVEVLVMPLYETLAAVTQAESRLAVPISYLAANARHWKGVISSEEDYKGACAQKSSAESVSAESAAAASAKEESEDAQDGAPAPSEQAVEETSEVAPQAATLRSAQEARLPHAVYDDERQATMRGTVLDGDLAVASRHALDDLATIQATVVDASCLQEALLAREQPQLEQPQQQQQQQQQTLQGARTVCEEAPPQAPAA